MHELLQHGGCVLGIRQAHVRDESQNVRLGEYAAEAHSSARAIATWYSKGGPVVCLMEDDGWIVGVMESVPVTCDVRSAPAPLESR